VEGVDADETLMARYVGGDPRALEVLFHRYAPRIRAFFARTFRDAAICDDLLQSTFLKLHTSRASFDAGLQLRPWLYTFAARARIDELRRRYRARHHGEVAIDDLPVEDEPFEEASPESQDARSRVRRALAALPEAQRAVVILHRFEGLTFAEIATILSESEGRRVHEGAVRVRAFRAYATLRDALAGADVSERAAE